MSPTSFIHIHVEDVSHGPAPSAAPLRILVRFSSRVALPKLDKIQNSEEDVSGTEGAISIFVKSWRLRLRLELRPTGGGSAIRPWTSSKKHAFFITNEAHFWNQFGAKNP